MSSKKHYELNPETLNYVVSQVPRKTRILRAGVVVLLSFVFISVFSWKVYRGDWEMPKTVMLQRENDRWSTKMEMMNRDLDILESELMDLRLRNEDIYRSIFGMNEIPPEVLDAGFGGVNRYAYLDDLPDGGMLKDTYIRLDALTKKTYVQSKSTDEVANLSKRAGEMASCTPAIIPIDPTPGSYRISSSFGGRVDPVHGGYRHHDGVDFATRMGNPIYSTGDGVIKEVKVQFFGYGNLVVIDHGFGYKTRYAHMSNIFVTEGMKVKRGDCIGCVGNSGKSTGSHLHYEVEYRGHKVNPANYFDPDVTPEEYAGMVRKRTDEGQAMLRPKFSVRRR